LWRVVGKGEAGETCTGPGVKEIPPKRQKRSGVERGQEGKKKKAVKEGGKKKNEVLLDL